MTETYLIRQAQAGYKREFAFGHEALACKILESSGEREFSVPYEAIDFSSPSTLTLKKTPIMGRLFLIGLLFMIGALTAASFGLPDAIAAALYVIGMLSFCVAIVGRLVGWFSAKFTVMRLSPPPPGTNIALTVIHDKRHDEVMAAIGDKWKKRLRTLYGHANPNGDHEKETARLAWLRDKGIIDDLAYHKELGKLTTSDADASLSTPLVN